MSIRVIRLFVSFDANAFRIRSIKFESPFKNENELTVDISLRRNSICSFVTKCQMEQMKCKRVFSHVTNMMPHLLHPHPSIHWRRFCASRKVSDKSICVKIQSSMCARILLLGRRFRLLFDAHMCGRKWVVTSSGPLLAETHLIKFMYPLSPSIHTFRESCD